jgi:hypothetical protein
MTDEQMANLADAAANEAVRHIQDALGVTTGHFAGLYFSNDDTWNTLQTILFDYIRAEVNQ